MNDHIFDAFALSPVPPPGPDAVPPEPFHGIYGMPSFIKIPTDDLRASVEFWTRGFGFFELFSVPGTIVHLRRWMFQDVLLVADDRVHDEPVPAMSVGFSCVLSELDGIASACRTLRPDDVAGPMDMPWGTRDIEVITPERARIVITAAQPYDPASAVAQRLADDGIVGPGRDAGDDSGLSEDDGHGGRARR